MTTTLKNKYIKSSFLEGQLEKHFEVVFAKNIEDVYGVEKTLYSVTYKDVSISLGESVTIEDDGKISIRVKMTKADHITPRVYKGYNLVSKEEVELSPEQVIEALKNLGFTPRVFDKLAYLGTFKKSPKLTEI